MTVEERNVFLSLLEGVEGYICENGYARHWDKAVIDRARFIAAQSSISGQTDEPDAE